METIDTLTTDFASSGKQSNMDSLAAKIYAAPEEVAQGFGSPANTPISKLDFSNIPKSVNDPVTPSTPAAVSAVEGETVDYNQFVMDTLTWTNRVRSAFYLVTGTILIVLIDWMLSREIPLLTVVCHLTLLQMALNFLRHAISPKLQQRATWLDSAWTAEAISKLAVGIKMLAAVHDKHLSADSPHKHLMIAIGLWMLSLLSCLIDPMHLVLVLYISAFIIPIAYKTNNKTIDPIVRSSFAKAKTHLEAADRRVKGVVIMVMISLLGLISNMDLMIAFFVACLFASSQLPKEMEDLSKKVAPVLTPIGNTATKMGHQIGRMMEGAVEKFELTPTPMKKKKQ